MSARILVADDDDDLRQYIELILTDDGHEVHTAAHGQDALDLYLPGRFDLLCLDLAMPLVDGIQVTRSVRSRGDRVPILMITGSGSSQKLAEARAAGIDELLTKPFRTLDLRARVSALLSGDATPLAQPRGKTGP